MTMVSVVDETSVQLAGSSPVMISVVATGKAASSGWSNGRLVRATQMTNPADGVLVLNFVADPPDQASKVLEVRSPISASLELAVDRIDDFWETNRGLAGIRVVAAHNSKSVEILPRPIVLELARQMSPRAVASIISAGKVSDALSFEEDIRPMFRPRDVNAMLALRHFNLHNYDDVKLWATRISEKLKIDMPCDGLWPMEDVDKFEAWIDGGMLP